MIRAPLLFLIPLIILGNTDRVIADETNCPIPVAQVISVQGSVERQQFKSSKWKSVQNNDKICPGDQIRNLNRSRAVISFKDKSYLTLDKNSALTFKQTKQPSKSILDILKGRFYFRNHDAPRSIELNTPFINAVHEGTEFVLISDSQKTQISVIDGSVLATNAYGKQSITNGQTLVSVKGQAPDLKLQINIENAIQWALYYPPLLNTSPQTTSNSPFASTIDYIRQSKIDMAFNELEAVPNENRDFEYHNLKANLLLSVGDVEQAQHAIQKSLSLNKNNGTALALQSIIALVKNNPEKALQLVERAKISAPSSSIPLIALSYIYETQFKLEKALSSLKKATQLNNLDALAWSRRAQIEIALGQFDLALNAAQRAVEIDGDLTIAQSVLGYSHLFHNDSTEALKLFTAAVLKTPQAPLARFGLGITKIRLGDLDEGSKEIERAVSLDLNNAVIRTYLGKAYYDQNRNDLAELEFNRAISLDPNDPSPWFYKAINKQTKNKPVEAISDMQQALDLNDKRGAYRSRLLLDQDLAAKSASMARIYSDLEFQQLARLEGWKALDIDPTDHSAHRFLADNYASLPRHGPARVSELLQSQLFQPIHALPVHAQSAQANLGLFQGTGPSTPTFNEYNALFRRNQFNFQASGVIGSNNTLGDEAILSGVSDNIGFSLGQFHYETDGFRENNDQDTNIYNFFIQANPSHKTSIQAELTHLTIDKGDLDLRFFSDDFQPELRQNQTVSTARLGLRHSFFPGSTFISSLTYRNIELDTSLPLFGIEAKDQGVLGEIQYLYNEHQYNVISGAGHYYVDKQTRSTFPVLDEDGELNHTNIYLYSTIKAFNSLLLTLGASADFLDKSDIERDQFNPKIGIEWNPFKSTIIRAAIFRTLQRSTISRENTLATIEPTEIAGFNQFYFGTIGEKAWRYGIGLDQTLTRSLNAGIEFSKRDLKSPTISLSPPFFEKQVINVDVDETLTRAYLYWTPFSQIALSAEYLYERLDSSRGELLIENVNELQTHRLPLSIGVFSEWGFSGKVKATYVYQEGEFPSNFNNLVALQDDDQFWVFDASLSYRLPNRYGVISLEGKNLLDQSIHFQDTDATNPTITPERQLLFKMALSF